MFLASKSLNNTKQKETKFSRLNSLMKLFCVWPKRLQKCFCGSAVGKRTLPLEVAVFRN